MNRRMLAVVLAVLVQALLVGVAVAPRLSARVTGEEYVLRVAPVDPIDPFRGAYVALDYPDLPQGRRLDGTSRDVFVPLVDRGDHWVGTPATLDRPEDGPYLTCADEGWRLACGIESWFLPQDEALALEESVAGGEAVAVLRVDGRGNAALVAVHPR